MSIFIEVIVPLPLRDLYVYEVDDNDRKKLKIGIRVIVPFRNNYYTAIIYRIGVEKPSLFKTKRVHHFIDINPIIDSLQLDLWFWLSSYYMCPIGDVFRVAMPSVFRLGNETLVTKEKDTEKDLEVDLSIMSDDELSVYKALNYRALSIDNLSKVLNNKDIIPIINNLIEKKLIKVEDVVKDKYKPKMVKYVRIHPDIGHDIDNLNTKVDGIIGKAPKQRELFMRFIQLKSESPLPVAKLLGRHLKMTSLKELEKKRVLQTYYLQTDRLEITKGEKPLSILSEEQSIALSKIRSEFFRKRVTFLYGVTSSGKTEVYIHLINEFISKGKQVLYLLPEIALTVQIVQRLSVFFGEKLIVYHSKYTDNEKAEIWTRISSKKSSIVLGTRSALFLPFKDLGLIVVDEEHDPSFKQQNILRYHARDMAIVLAEKCGANILLGSATPSLETIFNVKKGKYSCVEMTTRYGNIEMPEIKLIGIREQSEKKQMRGAFSLFMLKEIKRVLELGEQVILFQNRRGYSTIMECDICGTSMRCVNCDVSLTYHKYSSTLNCHYCDYVISRPDRCISCGSREVGVKGLGTQQVENQIKQIFPEAIVDRMDYDTTRRRRSFEDILERFSNKQIDILIGTQMVAKGLDFESVSLVGILNIDSIFNFPDFRAYERAYQLITQVAGRAGRKDKRGKVIIQSFNVSNSALTLLPHNYKEIMDDQLSERKQYNYPPYCKIIKIVFKHPNRDKLNKSTDYISGILRSFFKEDMLGPQYNIVPKIKNDYIKNIIIKIPIGKSISKVKRYINESLYDFSLRQEHKSIKLFMDVDSY
ncbi:replication restart helicase PriA [Ichthyobacterium seriolicida]|uniref:Replication restart protein PriA n=1 Tax=Ichthyobacterium seriolicida TaxID=242600 RepID=A0A1J1E7W6_9FLAO|nr:primosomal protein N' [Ichthyobacterium seriolicida]BAV95430.1 primosomal protein N' [Ichthyobacterium seriolicida]